MNLDDVMDEIAGRLDTITGLNVFAYPPPTVVPPAGIISYPEAIDYDETYGRGMDKIRGLPIILVVGKATEKSARSKVTKWASGSGDQSVKALLEAGDFSSCDDVQVTSCSFDVVTIAGIDYLAAMFVCDVVGSGT